MRPNPANGMEAISEYELPLTMSQLKVSLKEQKLFSAKPFLSKEKWAETNQTLITKPNKLKTIRTFSIFLFTLGLLNF